jgi:short-subunit dehydrogenase
MEVNLRGLFTCSRQVQPGMVARGRGCILNITSEAGVFRWPLVSGYAVSKAAVVKLTEGLAAELRGMGVCVFSVHPGLLPHRHERVGPGQRCPQRLAGGQGVRLGPSPA